MEGGQGGSRGGKGGPPGPGKQNDNYDKGLDKNFKGDKSRRRGPINLTGLVRLIRKCILAMRVLWKEFSCT